MFIFDKLMFTKYDDDWFISQEDNEQYYCVNYHYLPAAHQRCLGLTPYTNSRQQENFGSSAVVQIDELFLFALLVQQRCRYTHSYQRLFLYSQTFFLVRNIPVCVVGHQLFLDIVGTACYAGTWSEVGLHIYVPCCTQVHFFVNNFPQHSVHSTSLCWSAAAGKCIYLGLKTIRVKRYLLKILSIWHWPLLKIEEEKVYKQNIYNYSDGHQNAIYLFL